MLVVCVFLTIASATVVRLQAVGLEMPNLSSIGLGRIGIQALRPIRNQDIVLQKGPQFHTHFGKLFRFFVVFMGPPPEDDGIGANMKAKDAPALIRFKRSGRLFVVSHVVSENVVDRDTEIEHESVHLSENDKFQSTQRPLRPNRRRRLASPNPSLVSALKPVTFSSS